MLCSRAPLPDVEKFVKVRLEFEYECSIDRGLKWREMESAYQSSAPPPQKNQAACKSLDLDIETCNGGGERGMDRLTDVQHIFDAYLLF